MLRLDFFLDHYYFNCVEKWSYYGETAEDAKKILSEDQSDDELLGFEDGE